MVVKLPIKNSIYKLSKKRTCQRMKQFRLLSSFSGSLEINIFITHEKCNHITEAKAKSFFLLVEMNFKPSKPQNKEW